MLQALTDGRGPGGGSRSQSKEHVTLSVHRCDHTGGPTRSPAGAVCMLQRIGE